MPLHHLRALMFTILVIVGCASTAQPPVTVPQRSLTASDTVTRLALAGALAAFHSPSGRRIIVSSSDGHLTPHGLPDSDGLTFVVLSRTDIQRFADDSGDVSYFEISPVVFVGDTARIGITLTSAHRRPEHTGPVVMGGASSCEWLVVRYSRGWVLVGPRNCFTLG